ncbi:MAG: sulfatase-like hydrolase/transferase [Cyclobacteriaceae bacterium]
MLIRKPTFLIAILTCLTTCNKPTTESNTASTEQTKTPNVLILLADDLGYGDLSCYGHPVIQTPNLDQLASEGVRLTDCYSAAPVCSPSRAGLLTGRMPNRLGIYDWIPEGSPMHIHEGETTIAQLFQQHGYATGQFGKWHCNGKFNSAEQPQAGDLGFEYWFGTQNNASPSHHNPANFVRNGTPVGEIEGFSSHIVADEAINWLEEQADQEKPFFAYVAFHEPHEPVASPPKLVEEYTAAAINEDQAQYFANVTNMDRAVGKLLQTLDDLHLAENTLVIFTSDNGPETLNRYEKASRSYGSPGTLRGMKLYVYEGGMRVPGIMRWPGHIDAGQVSSQPISSLDFFPTFSAMLGQEMPTDRTYDGTDISTFFNNQPVEREQPLLWVYPTALGGPTVGMRAGDWKLLGYTKHRYLPKGNTRGILIDNETMNALKQDSLDHYELYSIRQNPSEWQDVGRAFSPLQDSLQQLMQKYYYQLQEDSPVLDLEVK